MVAKQFGDECLAVASFARGFGKISQFQELTQGARCKVAKHTDTLSGFIDNLCQLIVLILKHLMLVVKIRTLYIPVSVTSLRIEYKFISQQLRKLVGNFSFRSFLNSNLGFHISQFKGL